MDSAFLDDIADRVRKHEEAELEQRRAAQIAAGRIDLIPYPKGSVFDPFRSELTVEQNSLFVSNDYKETCRVFKPDPDGAAKITVGKVSKRGRGRGVLTQAHQDVFYKLLRLWEEQQHALGIEKTLREHGRLTMSAYDLVLAIRGSDGEEHYHAVQELVRDLAAIPIVMEHVHTWRGFEQRVEFTLLGDVQWREANVDEQTRRPKPDGISEVRIWFSDFVTEGFMRRHVKPLLSRPYFELGRTSEEGKKRGPRAEIARLLYPFLDGQLHEKAEYLTKLDALADRFCLRRYRFKSQRREQFAFAVSVLDGKPIQEGRHILRTSLRPSQDGLDFVLVARRESGQLSLLPT